MEYCVDFLFGKLWSLAERGKSVFVGLLFLEEYRLEIGSKSLLARGLKQTDACHAMTLTYFLVMDLSVPIYP